MKSFLAFPIDIDYFSGEQVSVTPPGDLFTEIGGVLNNISDLGYEGTVIAAGSEADVRFHLGANQARSVYSDLDTVAYLAGIIESGVNVLTLMESRLGKNPKAVLDAIAQGRCADELGQLSPAITSPINLAALDQISQTAIDCASTVVDLGVGGTIDGIIGAVDGLIENVLQSAFGAVILIVGGPNGTNTAITVKRLDIPTAYPDLDGGGAVPPKFLALANQVIALAEQHNIQGIANLDDPTNLSDPTIAQEVQLLNRPGALAQLIQVLTKTHTKWRRFAQLALLLVPNESQ